MTSGLERRAILTVGLLVAGVLLAFVAIDVDRGRWRRGVVGLALSMLAAGGLMGINTSTRHHIHLCHEHGADSCDAGHHATGGIDHEHFFGRW